jgi:ribosomal-protein-alanine N-acetyltransferase
MPEGLLASGIFFMSRIETERLILSLYTENERGDFVKLLTDPSVMRYVDKGVLTAPQAESLWARLMERWYPQGVDTIWAVFAKDDGRYVGNASVRPRPEKPEEWEIGYYLCACEWGKGYATELARRLVDHAFDHLGLREVYATVDVENLASRHVLEKAGLELYREEYDEQGVFFVYRVEQDPPV